jgi:hypothetical protein
MNPSQAVSDPEGPAIFQQLGPRRPLPALSLIPARFQLRQETLAEFDGSGGMGIRNAHFAKKWTAGARFMSS